MIILNPKTDNGLTIPGKLQDMWWRKTQQTLRMGKVYLKVKDTALLSYTNAVQAYVGTMLCQIKKKYWCHCVNISVCRCKNPMGVKKQHNNKKVVA